jgi:hypothetical protein
MSTDVINTLHTNYMKNILYIMDFRHGDVANIYVMAKSAQMEILVVKIMH